MTLLDGLRRPGFYIPGWFKPCPSAPTPEYRKEIPENTPPADGSGAAIDNPPATRLPIPAETRTMTTLAGAADQGVRSSADSHFSNPASFSRARVAATTPVKATKG
jgi:hypothetical protein